MPQATNIMSNPNMPDHKVTLAFRLLAAYVGVVGFYFLIELARQLIHTNFRNLFSLLFMIPELLMLITILIALAIARHAWRAQTGRNVRRLLVVSFIIIFFQSATVLDWVARQVAPEAMSKREVPWSLSFWFILALCFTLCYYASRRWLGRGDFLPTDERPALLQPPAREWISVLAIILWLLIEEWFDVWFSFIPKTEISLRSNIVHFFCPIALAWLFHRVLYRRLCRFFPEPSPPAAMQAPSPMIPDRSHP